MYISSIKILFLISTVLLSTTSLFAQKEANIWYFGEFAGLDFNSGNAVPLNDSKMKSWEGSASIADSNGNLLFYTNGITIWNKNHEIMSNGDGLAGSDHSCQSSLIIQNQYNKNRYYVFTVDHGGDFGGRDKGIQYSVVDMNLDNGLGSVVSLNNKILYPACEMINATFHENGKDIWLLTRKYKDDTFYLYLINQNGISFSPIVTKVGHDISVTGSAIGRIKFSPSGNKILFHQYEAKDIWLMSFNKATGELSNFIKIKSIWGGHPYQYSEFSPDETKFFSTYHTNPSTDDPYSYIYQFDISDTSNITNELLYQEKNIDDDQHFGQMQLASNGKIYIVRGYDNKIAVINRPNEKGMNCSFSPSAITLTNGKCNLGITNIFAPYIYYDCDILATTEVCEGDSIYLSALPIGNIENPMYEWKGPDYFNAYDSSLVITGATPSMSGMYYVTLTEPKTMKYTKDSIYITVHPKPTAVAGRDTTICKGESVRIGKNVSTGTDNYIWSSPATLDSPNSPYPLANPAVSTIYTLQVENEFGCVNYDTVVVKVIESNMIFSNVKDTLDFETMCKNISNSKTFTLTNGADFPTKFKATITNNPNNYFDFIDNNANQLFSENETKTIGIEFKGVATNGKYTAKLNFTDTCGNAKSIELVAQVQDISYIVQDTLDFGRMCINSSKDASFTLKNTTPSPTSFLGTFNNSSFNLTDNTLGTKFLMNETKNIVVRFNSGATAGNILDSLIIHDLCNNTKKVILKAEIVSTDLDIVASIDFGKVCAGDTRDTSIAIRNLSTIPTAFTANLQSDDNSFELINNPFSTKFSLNESRDLQIRFTGSQNIGEHSGTITLSDTCGNSYITTMNVYIPEIKFAFVTNNVLDSASNGVAVQKVLKFVNEGKDDLVVNKVDGIDAPYSIVDIKPALNATLKQFDTLFVTVEFQEQTKGIYYDTLNVSGDLQCTFSSQISLEMLVSSISANTILAIESRKDTVEPGEEITVPLTLLSSKNMIQSGIKDWQATISFNKSLLLPIDDKLISNIENGANREITISGSMTQSEGIIYPMKFLAALGNSECTALTIKEFEWYGGDYTIDTMINGSVCIKICKEGGDRLLNLDEILKLEVLGPSPAEETINLNIALIEKGEHELSLIDILGQTLHKWQITSHNGYANNNFKISTTSLTNGQYILILKTPSGVLTRSVWVVK